MTEIVGLLFAGGQGRRLGGVDQALIELGGKPLWKTAVERLEKHASFIIATSPNEPSWMPQADQVTFAPDPEIYGEPIGPAGGLLSGLEFADRIVGPGSILITSPVDVPLIPIGTFERLIEAVSDGAPVSVVHVHNRIQPVFAAWHASCLSKVRDLIESGERSMGQLVKSCGAVKVEFEPHEDAFFNINTKGDLDYARRKASIWFEENE